MLSIAVILIISMILVKKLNLENILFKLFQPIYKSPFQISKWPIQTKIVLICIIIGILVAKYMSFNLSDNKLSSKKINAINSEKEIIPYVPYESLSYEEKLKKHIGNSRQSFDKIVNDTVYITYWVDCVDANRYGDYGTMSGRIWVCGRECWDFMDDAYRLANKFNQIKFIEYSIIATAKDKYGYTTQQRRGSFKIDIDKEELKLYKTISDISVSQKLMDSCTIAQMEEKGDWKKVE